MKAFYNQAPLIYNQRALLSPARIRPEGWLLVQMQKQADALKAFLKEWPVLEKKDDPKLSRLLFSIEMPGLYDAVIRLGFSLGDAELKEKAEQYADWVIESQKQDGSFGQEDKTADTVNSVTLGIVYLHALYTFFAATGDKRVLQCMDRFFHYETAFMEKAKGEGMPQLMAGDNMYLAIKLYNITKQRYLLDLCETLRRNTIDWTSLFHTFPMIQPISKIVPKDEKQTESRQDNGEQLRENTYRNYSGCNVAAGLRTPGIVSAFKSGYKELSGFRTGWEKLCRYHMSACGMFSSDYLLNGNSPSAGCSSKALTETIVSMSMLLDTGEFGTELTDALEKLAYNALPAMWDRDSSMQQEVQQTNQITLGGDHHGWYNASSEANAYCPAKDDFSKGSLFRAWARFADLLWMATKDGGLYAVSYAPCVAEHVIDDVPVRIRVRGDYPFSESLEIHVAVKKAVEFPLYLRIPSWAVNPMIYLPGGEIMTVRPGETACIRMKWESTSSLRLILSRQVRICSWSHQSAAVEAGALIMALPLDGADNKKTQADKWAWALDTSEPMKMTYKKDTVECFKNGTAPLTVRAKIYPCRGWKKEGDDAGSIPIQPKCDKTQSQLADLVPYGYTNLRIAQFPAAKTEDDHA